MWRNPEGQYGYSNWTRFTDSLTPLLLHSRFNSPFYMLIVHRSTHLQIGFRQKTVHAFFLTLTLVTFITDRGLLHFAVLTQDGVIFLDIPLISSSCDDPNSLLMSSFISPKFLRVFSEASDFVSSLIKWHSFVNTNLSKLWKVKWVTNFEQTKNFPGFTLLLFF